jgi:hypothetical protein
MIIDVGGKDCRMIRHFLSTPYYQYIYIFFHLTLFLTIAPSWSF